MKSFLKDLFKQTIIPSLGLTLAVLTCISPMSCKTSVEGIQMLEGDFSSPEFENLCVKSSRNLILTFNKEISIQKASFFLKDSSEDSKDNQEITLIEYAADKKSAELTLPSATETGKKYTLEATVADSQGNTLTQSCTFTGFNARVPQLILSEIYNGYDKNKGGEYVEVKALSDGNLSGIELLIAGDEKRDYKGCWRFPPLEVKKGMFITIHTRSIEDWENAVDEDCSNLKLSKAPYSSDTALDLWIKNTKTSISYEDAIVIRNSADSKILDCILISTEEEKNNPWPQNYQYIINQIKENEAWVNSQGQVSISKEDCVIDSNKSKSHKSHFARKNICEIKEKNKMDSSALGWTCTSGIKNLSPGLSQ